MAHIQKRTDRHGYRARYVDPVGKERSRTFRRKIDAQRWLDELTADRLTGRYVDPTRAKTTVGAVADEYLLNPRWKASTRARNRNIIEKHLRPRFGDMAVADMDYEVIQSWVNDQVAAGASAGTVRKHASVLSGVLTVAVKTKRLAANPVPQADLPRQRLAKRRYLTHKQVEALADASGDYSDVVLTLAYCGLRIGELAALRIGNVNALRRRFQVEESVTEVDGKLEWSSTKDHQRRSVPYPAFLADAIETRMDGRGPDDLLFGTGRGAPLRVRNMRRDWFDRAAVEAGIKGLTPHELRHTAASLAVSVGANVLAVQRMLGHEKASMTLDTYSDLFDSDLEAVAEQLSTARAENLTARRRPGASSGEDYESKYVI